jgi:hypothetical protein
LHNNIQQCCSSQWANARRAFNVSLKIINRYFLNQLNHGKNVLEILLSLQMNEAAAELRFHCFLLFLSKQLGNELIQDARSLGLCAFSLQKLASNDQDELDAFQAALNNIQGLRVLVCGGDGTNAWALGVLDQFSPSGRPPPIGSIALGSGNDFSNAIGWGDSYKHSISALKGRVVFAHKCRFVVVFFSFHLFQARTNCSI